MRDEGGAKREEPRRSQQDRMAGLAGLVDFVRSIPDRMRRPESLLMLMALLASLGAHMPPWVGLGALAEYFHKLDQERPKPLPPSEVSFEVTEPAKPAEEPKLEEPKPEKVKPPKPEKEKLAKLEPPKPEEPKAPPPEPPKKPEPEPKNVSKVDIVQPPPAEQRKQSVTQKSADPDVEPPPDAKFLAEENNRVAEETVAMITDEHHDDPEPQASAPQAAGPEESGDNLKDEKGADKGQDEPQPEPPKVASVDRKQPRPAQPEPEPQPQPPQPVAKPAVPAQPSIKPVPAQPQIPQGEVIQDPMGSFVLAPAVPGQAGQAGRAGRAGQTGPAPNLKVSWRTFENTFGAEQLAQDRMPREAKRRGAGREKRWNEFRAAIENYVVGVKPGNTSALNTAADPFAAYLAAFHRNLHMEFAHEFLESLPALGEFGDMNLVTKVEIVINPDGSLDRVGVVKSSGNLMYDFGAFNAVQRGAPYPPPPEKIRSPDGRVYMRWALHRNESQCGTWNAEPYIVKTPPRSPNDPKPDSVSPYRPAGGGGDDDGQHGRAPRNEPAQPAPPHPSVPAPRPGETMGRAPRKGRASTRA